MLPRPVSPASRRRVAASALLALAWVAATGCSGSDSVNRSDGPPSSGPPSSGPPSSAVAAPAGPTSGSGPSSTATPASAPQLPRGGRTILPAYRVVAYYGAGTTAGLGVLGRGSPDQAAARLERQAAAYVRFGRPVLPCLELITTVAAASPGPDGRYSNRTSPRVVQRYLDAARRHKMILMLDFQPGRDSFLRQVKAYERFLEQPDVSVALDPEWKMTATQVPGRVIGRTDAGQVNSVVDYVAAIVARGRLPQKLFVVHQFTEFMIGHRTAVKTPPGLAVTFHVDGFGGQRLKIEKYRALHARAPYFTGFKLFYTEDTDLMSPRQAMALRPRPDMISYQ